LELAQVRFSVDDRATYPQPTRQINGIARNAARAEGSLAQRHSARR
jgi:hypothetical protein